ncbi:DgyrCDS10893 [Dimorphilus gyrociliatus]|uniref:DgyrCDS10892 n=1 Tax=Dimorphilus gyrociliatus TaxID=2664684 RepID=A0A7I8W330_9ANNE|nr:DgyrCDS10892 [Dimorphilus gyrociliatus]CAD5122470.1 DgyrCDS10893 [Dimorphilus gyrociliatus]
MPKRRKSATAESGCGAGIEYSDGFEDKDGKIEESKQELKEENLTQQPVRCSSRRLKKPKKSDAVTSSLSPTRKLTTSEVKQTNNTNGAIQPGTKSQPQLWSCDDQAAFFEALNDNGRNFDKILAYINSKQKKKNEDLKSREQIRHYYYRTWHKVSKFLEIHKSKDVNCKAVELYGMINYGEFKRRVGYLNKKNAFKFNELVQQGSCNVKNVRKGKGCFLRIKTPTCKALRNLHKQDLTDGDEKESGHPDIIVIELLPRNTQCWIKVQQKSYNPRLRLNLQSKQSLSSIISFIERRWNFQLSSNEELRLFPKEGAELHSYMAIQHIDFSQKNVNFSLKLYKDTCADGNVRQTSKKSKKQTTSTKIQLSENNDNDPVEKNGTDENENTEKDRFVNILTKKLKDLEKDYNSYEDSFEEKVNDIKLNGWNKENGKDYTALQLWYMLKKPDQIHLEYDFISTDKDKVAIRSSLLKALIPLATSYKESFSEIENEKCPCGREYPQTLNMLQDYNNVSTDGVFKSPKVPKPRGRKKNKREEDVSFKAPLPIQASPLTPVSPQQDISISLPLRKGCKKTLPKPNNRKLLPAVRSQTQQQTLVGVQIVDSDGTPKIVLLPQNTIAAVSPQVNQQSTTNMTPSPNMQSQQITNKEQSALPPELPVKEASMNNKLEDQTPNREVLVANNDSISLSTLLDLNFTNDEGVNGVSDNSIQTILASADIDPKLLHQLSPQKMPNYRSNLNTPVKVDTDQLNSSRNLTFTLPSGSNFSVSQMLGDSSRDSLIKTSDVDAVMNENSLDYTAKFFDLASQINCSNEGTKGNIT